MGSIASRGYQMVIVGVVAINACCVDVDEIFCSFHVLDDYLLFLFELHWKHEEG